MRWELKLLYVIGVIAVGYAIAALLRLVGASDLANFTGLIVDTTGVLYGARVFRARGEPVRPPRAWWRMTGWPTLSRSLGILFTVLATIALISLLQGILGATPSTPLDLAAAAAFLIEMAFFAWLYLNSTARLRRAGITAPPKFPKPVKLTR